MDLPMRLKPERVDPEMLAIQVLGFLAGQPARLARFLDITGLEPQTLRKAAASPGFHASVLAYLIQDESLLLAFAAEAGMPPERVIEAERRLSSP
jgi:hypothetical protein